MKRFWTDLWWLMLYSMGGLLLTVAIISVLPYVCKGTLLLHLGQWAQNLLWMILPAVAWTRYYKKERVRVVLHTKWPGWQIMGLVALLMVVVAPCLDLLALACEHLPLPTVVEEYASSMKTQQDAAIQVLLDVEGFGGWMALIALMCVMTGLGEEVLFRGALLRCFVAPDESLSPSRYLSAIVWVGLIFSLFHGEVYGFIPRWLLGSAFAWLVFATGSIWPGVLAHALNNLWALIGMKTTDPQLLECGPVEYGVSLALSLLVGWMLVRVIKRGRH